MRDNFNEAVDFVIRQEVEPGHELEGSLHETPGDPGGTTCFGFAQRYQMFDVATLQNNRPLAEQKYLELYWIPSGCDDLPWPLDLLQFDASVNMGRTDANTLLVSAKGNGELYLWNRLQEYWRRNRDSIKKTGKGRVGFEDWIKRCINLKMFILQKEGSK